MANNEVLDQDDMEINLQTDEKDDCTIVFHTANYSQKS